MCFYFLFLNQVIHNIAEINRDDQLANDSYHSLQSSDSISRSTIPSIKFHLNLILESSKNANSSLTQCLVLISHQNQVRKSLFFFLSKFIYSLN